MKKFILLVMMIGTMALTTGCSLLSDKLEGSTIYVTNYPIKYIVEKFYKNHATIVSIYPSDADTTTYQLTEKQIRDYSKGSMFIYNGLSDEKKLAKDFLSKNSDILLADVSYGLSIVSSVEELWLSPNNYLMLAKNVRDSFKEYLNNKTVIEEIETRYNELAETLSIMDADLRSIGEYAKSKNKTMILGESKAYKFLENYGFNVVVLDDAAYQTDDGINTIKNNYKNGKYSVLLYDNSASSTVAALLQEKKNNAIKLSKMTNGISEEDYINTIQQFINTLRYTLSN